MKMKKTNLAKQNLKKKIIYCKDYDFPSQDDIFYHCRLVKSFRPIAIYRYHKKQ